MKTKDLDTLLEKYENMGIAKPIKKRKKVESLLEKLKILKKRKKK
jgi:hypothetical protein